MLATEAIDDHDMLQLDSPQGSEAAESDEELVRPVSSNADSQALDSHISSTTELCLDASPPTLPVVQSPACSVLDLSDCSFIESMLDLSLDGSDQHESGFLDFDLDLAHELSEYDSLCDDLEAHGEEDEDEELTRCTSENPSPSASNEPWAVNLPPRPSVYRRRALLPPLEAPVDPSAPLPRTLTQSFSMSPNESQATTASPPTPRHRASTSEITHRKPKPTRTKRKAPVRARTPASTDESDSDTHAVSKYNGSRASYALPDDAEYDTPDEKR